MTPHEIVQVVGSGNGLSITFETPREAHLMRLRIYHKAAQQGLRLRISQRESTLWIRPASQPRVQKMEIHHGQE